jgi:hypothetical protein
MTVTDLITNQVYPVSGGFTVTGTTNNGISATAITTAQNLTVGMAMASFSPLTASGGSLPYAYSYSGALPAGLLFSTATGVVSGTPTATNTIANLVFSVKDANNIVASTTSTVSFTVNANAVVGVQMGGARQGAQLALSTTVSFVSGSLFNFNGDGIGSAAGFSAPNGVTTDGLNLFVADTRNNLIRKVALSNYAVTTIAGGGNGYNQACCNLTYAIAGALDGNGLNASFSNPNWITTDGTNLYVTDQLNYKIRQVVIATGVVTTLAGSGAFGSADGIRTAASFSNLEGITTDGINLYVADTTKIRRVVIATGDVSTLSLVNAAGAAVNIPSKGITTDGVNLYATDGIFVWKIVISSGESIVLAGGAGNGYCLDIDGVGALASFCHARGITTDGQSLFIAGNDNGSAHIRKVEVSTGQVTTLAGGGAQWDANGIGTSAGFRTPTGITTDGVNLYVLDASKIRKIQ